MPRVFVWQDERIRLLAECPVLHEFALSLGQGTGARLRGFSVLWRGATAARIRLICSADASSNHLEQGAFLRRAILTRVRHHVVVAGNPELDFTAFDRCGELRELQDSHDVDQLTSVSSDASFPVSSLIRLSR